MNTTYYKMATFSFESGYKDPCKFCASLRYMYCNDTLIQFVIPDCHTYIILFGKLRINNFLSSVSLL